MSAFGAALEALRKKRGISQEKLALETGMDRTYITALCRGRHSPSLSILFLLAPILGITPGSFIKCIDKRRQEYMAQQPGS